MRARLAEIGFAGCALWEVSAWHNRLIFQSDRRKRRPELGIFEDRETDNIKRRRPSQPASGRDARAAESHQTPRSSKSARRHAQRPAAQNEKRLLNEQEHHYRVDALGPYSEVVVWHFLRPGLSCQTVETARGNRQRWPPRTTASPLHLNHGGIGQERDIGFSLIWIDSGSDHRTERPSAYRLRNT